MLLLDRYLAGEDFYPCIEQKYLCSPKEWRSYHEHLQSSFPKAIPFEISNVADYLYLGTPQEEWDLFADFPGAIPPFSETWLEWRLPTTTNSNGRIVPLTPSQVFDKQGCFMAIEDLDADTLKANAIMCHAARNGVLFIGAVCCFCIRKRDGAPISANNASMIDVAMGHTTAEVGYAIPGVNDRFRREARSDPSIGEYLHEECSMLYPAMLALSLMNCRNVKVRDVANTRQLIRQADREGKPISRSYKVIEIQPFIQQAAAETGDHGYSREAAKIIRGHFKDYTQGEGLFGRLKGRFWWAQQLHGKVKRDFHYELAEKSASLNRNWFKRKRRLR